MTEVIKVVIVDDQWMIRDGLAALAQIADGIEVLATGSDGREAIELVARHRPDVVLMDIKMPRLDGIEATRQIKRDHPAVQILILTTFVDDDLVQEALGAGAAGYLTKDITSENLAAAIASAGTGMIQLAPEAARRLATTKPPDPSNSRMQTAIDSLTPREQEVLAQLATGASNPEIARTLNLSPGTVKNHVSSILRQLAIPDRTRAAIVASQHRIGNPPD